MKKVTYIMMTNENNGNMTEVSALVTPEEIGSALCKAGWDGGPTDAGGSYEKDGVYLLLEEKELFESVDETLQRLFFSS